MYYRHFGLSGPPFQFTPLASGLFMSKEHREGLAALQWGIQHEPSGFTVLTGETGVGKTTLICAVLARQVARVRTVYISNPKLSADEILVLTLKQLGVALPAAGRLNYLLAFGQFLSRLKPGERVAIVIDEAQDLSDDLLEELRLLSNHSRPEEQQIQLILVGQPELTSRLAKTSLRQINERIGARAVLHPLTAEESYAYVQHRLAAVGGEIGRIFDTRALRLMIKQSGGLPRRLNVLCYNAMLLACGARAQLVDLKMAQAAVREYTSLPPDRLAGDRGAQHSRRPLGTWAAALAALALVALGAVSAWSYHWVRSPKVERPAQVVVPPVAASQQTTSGAKVLLPAAAPQAVPAVPVAPALPVAAEPHLSVSSAPKVEAGINSSGVSTSTGTREMSIVPAADPSAKPELEKTMWFPVPASAAEKPAQPPSISNGTVKVRHGDTLSGIAVRYFGNSMALVPLIAANPQLADANRIFPGDLIRLPRGGASYGRE